LLYYVIIQFKEPKQVPYACAWKINFFKGLAV